MASTQTSGETQCQGALGTGTQFTYAQLEGLWVNAGGAAAQAPIMAAIAMAESGGCSTAYNPSGATGLWQILGAVDAADQGNLTDPAVNAHEAVLKYTTQGLTAWATYTSGAYTAFMANNVSPDTSVPTAATDTSATSSAPSSTCITGTAFGFCPLSKSEARALIGGMCMVAGALIALPGIILLAAFAFRGSGAASATGQAASVLEHAPGYGHAIRYARQRGARS